MIVRYINFSVRKGINMASIRKRGDKVYQISIYLGLDSSDKKKFHYETFYGIKSEAKDRARELEVKFKCVKQTMRRNRNGSRKVPKNVEQLLELWLDDTRNVVTERTYEKYAWHVKRLIPVIGDLEVFNLGPLEIRERLKKIEGLSERTVKDLYATMRTALNYASSLELIGSDLMRGIRSPKVVRKDRNVLDLKELAVFLKIAKDYKHYLIIRILALTGMRTGEALGLKWRDVDFEKRTITIVRAADTKHRKLKDTKTENSKRVIELDEESIEELSKLFKSISSKVSSNDLIFQNGDGRPLRYGAVMNTKNRVLAKSGLHHIRLHDLRHGVASILIDQGHPVTLVAATLGQTPSTTANTYSHALRRGKSIAALIGG
ncbi:site-specific recombinase XerD [Desulfosporosinus acidiphilus SJ4]|uniref:Site-specific recombinase XerD n=2 Tax=Desulfosporosinus TaxID=79206 RepID=I4D3A0_DESAJ|nr:site-specific recombinase XerD [Desulfosporosinus acidiphilus SJ4]